MSKENLSAAQVPAMVKAGTKWMLIREDFLAQNLKLAKEDPAFTLRDCAKAHGVSYDALRKVAGEQKWKVLLKKRVEELQKEAMTRIRGVALFDELEIRTRQATYARLASSLAHQRLLSLSEKEIKRLSIKNAIDLMKLGLTEERQALGIGDTFRVPVSRDGERALSESQVFAVARRVLELRKGTDGSYGTPDTE